LDGLDPATPKFFVLKAAKMHANCDKILKELVTNVPEPVADLIEEMANKYFFWYLCRIHELIDTSYVPHCYEEHLTFPVKDITVIKHQISTQYFKFRLRDKEFGEFLNHKSPYQSYEDDKRKWIEKNFHHFINCKDA